MGLIKAALGAAGGVLADQWKDYFYCEAISADGNAPAARRRPESSARSAARRSPPACPSTNVTSVAGNRRRASSPPSSAPSAATPLTMGIWCDRGRSRYERYTDKQIKL